MAEATIAMAPVSRLLRFVESERFRNTVVGLIAVNAVLLGVETTRILTPGARELVVGVNQAILGLFVIELVLRIAAHRGRFFREAWSIFDFVIVALALIIPAGPFQVVRALRILRALRMVSAVPSLRRVVDGLLGAVPGIASVFLLLILVLYIAAVMATLLFRDIAPDNFGHLGASLFSLFQILTLEGWSGIARQVMAEYGWAWIFFVSYILIGTFLVLNLVIGVVVSSIQSRIQAEAGDLSSEHSNIQEELAAIRGEIALLRESLDRKDPPEA